MERNSAFPLAKSLKNCLCHPVYLFANIIVSKDSYSKCKWSQSGYRLMIHVLEKHDFPVSIVETLFLAVCLEQWLSVWEMLATKGHLPFY